MAAKQQARREWLIGQRGCPSLRGHCKTTLSEMTPVTASAKAPINQVEVRALSRIGAKRTGHSLSGADALPADLAMNVGIRLFPNHMFIKWIGCRADIANGLN
jgi:hypothetical protein